MFYALHAQSLLHLNRPSAKVLREEAHEMPLANTKPAGKLTDFRVPAIQRSCKSGAGLVRRSCASRSRLVRMARFPACSGDMGGIRRLQQRPPTFLDCAGRTGHTGRQSTPVVRTPV
jgi:hypothetical protein